MPNEANQKNNPIGEKYADIVGSFLEAHKGRVIDERVILYLSDLVASTECELLGLTEASEAVGISRQRMHQLKDHIPMAAKISAGSLWLREDVVEFQQNRNSGPS